MRKWLSIILLSLFLPVLAMAGTVTGKVKLRPANCYTYFAILSAPDYVVTPTPTVTYQYDRLSSAIQAAMVTGDRDLDGTIRICIERGTYVDTTMISMDPWTSVTYGTGTEPVVITSSTGPRYTILQPATTNTPILSVTATTPNRSLTINKLQLRDGSASNGAAININEATVTLINVWFNSNVATGAGGALRSDDGIITMTNNQFLSNQAETGGAIYLDGGLLITTTNLYKGNSAKNGGAVGSHNASLIDNHSRFFDNTAEFAGGALYTIQTTVTLDGTEFTDSLAGNTGGALYVHGIEDTPSAAVFTDVLLQQNEAGQVGGAVFAKYLDLTITNTDFIANTAEHGGGAYVTNTSLILSQATFQQNQAVDNAGALGFYQSANGMIEQTTFTENSANAGGAIYSGEATLAITASQLTNNTAVLRGGGLSGSQSTITVTNSLLADNTARAGGGIYSNNGLLTVIDANFIANHAAVTTATPTYTENGGAIRSLYGETTIQGSTFDNNAADLHGGAVDFTYTPNFTISDSIFTNNTAITAGGALRIYDSTGTLSQITADSNVGDHGPGFAYIQLSTVDVQDSTITNNASWSTATDGGALTLVDSTFTAVGITADGNHCHNSCGGAFFYQDAGTVAFTQTTITNNISDQYVGAIKVTAGTLDLTNVILAGNNELNATATQSDALFAMSGATVNLTNSILAGNGTLSPTPASHALFTVTGAQAHLVNSIVAYNQGMDIGTESTSTFDWTAVYDTVGATMSYVTQASYTAGTGNLTVDPMFVGDGTTTNPFTAANINAFDFTLQSTSSLVNVGDPTVVDPDGSISDIGAYGGPLGAW